VNPLGIPAELKERRQWVLWRYDWDGKGWGKVPYQTSGTRKAKTNDPKTWGDYPSAIGRYQQDHAGGWSGVGYVFSPEDPYCGVDLDHCRDPQGGVVSDEAWDVIDAMGTYTEVSPSATGAKLILRGRRPGTTSTFTLGHPGLDKVEVYSEARYFALTGQRLDGTPAEIIDQQAALELLYGRGFRPPGSDDDGPVPPRVRERLASLERQFSRYTGDMPAEQRAAAYLDACPEAVSGQGGHKVAFWVARAVVYGFNLGREVGFRLLWDRWNDRCRPPWSEKELRHKAADADEKPFGKPRGWMLLGRAWWPRASTPSRGKAAGKDDPQAAEQPPGYVPNWITTEKLLACARPPAWLVRPVIVTRQLGIIGAPKKTLKTSLMIDLAVSLSAGVPFLGHFPVPRKLRVVMLSGESGEWVTAETVRRVCVARGVIDPASLKVVWGFRLPRLAWPADLASLGRGLAAFKAEVLILDPLYLSLLCGVKDLEASSIYDIGPLLGGVAETCLAADCTPLLVHHANRQLRVGDVMELEHLAFAGIQEAARQWLLLSRQEAYEPGSGLHRLWMSYGGSAGHSGLQSLEVDEGRLSEDFTGRRWEVRVATAGEGRVQQKQAAKRETKGKDLEKQAEEDTRFLLALDRLDPLRAGVSTREVRDLARMSNDKARQVMARLKDQDVIEVIADFKVRGGKGAANQATGVRRTQRSFET
jgi:hypothetical protein